MKNTSQWKASKFLYENGKLKINRNQKFLSPSSRLIASLTANFYNFAIPKYAKGSLLDLGCGQVPLYEAYKSRASDVICMDWDNAHEKLIHLDISCDLNGPIPVDNEAIDTIILSDVLEHIKNPFSLWQEMERMLRPEGIIILNVPFYYWLHADPYDYYRYTKFALSEMAQDHNMEILFLEEIGGAPEVLTDIIAKLTEKIPAVGRRMSIIIQSINMWIFMKTALGRKITKKTAHRFPLGYGMVVQKKKTEVNA